MKSLHVKYDPIQDVLNIEGVKYSGEIFRRFSTSKPEDTFKVIDNSQGVLTMLDVSKEYRKSNEMREAAAKYAETFESKVTKNPEFAMEQRGHDIAKGIRALGDAGTKE